MQLPSKPEIFSFTEADERLEGLLSGRFQGSYDTVLIFPGNVSIKGNFEAEVRKLVEGDFDLIAIPGDLVVEGRIRLYDGTPGLWVFGTTTAETLEGGDCEIYLNRGKFKYFIYGDYNDGVIEAAAVDTPWAINNDHCMSFSTGNKTQWIDNSGGCCQADYQFKSHNINKSFVREVRRYKETQIDIEKFYRRLVAGKRVLAAGAKTPAKDIRDIEV